MRISLRESRSRVNPRLRANRWDAVDKPPGGHQFLNMQKPDLANFRISQMTSGAFR